MGSDNHGEDFFGMHIKETMVAAESVVMKKNPTNEIGFVLDGGAPLCPCLYVFQINEELSNGKLQCGDEILGVNGVSVKGKNKNVVKEMIQLIPDEFTIHYKKLHADPSQGETLGSILKKMEQRMLNNVSRSTAETIELTREIFAHDSLVKRLRDLQVKEQMYKDLADHTKQMIKTYMDLLMSLRMFGEVYSEMSVSGSKVNVSEMGKTFGNLHNYMEKDSVVFLEQVKPVLNDLEVYTKNVIPKTKIAVERYAKAKFAYFIYSMNVRQLHAEEHRFEDNQQTLTRVETGNYELRLILRCSQVAHYRLGVLSRDVLKRLNSIQSEQTKQLTEQLRQKIGELESFQIKTNNRLIELASVLPHPAELRDSVVQCKTSTFYLEREEPNNGGIYAHENSSGSIDARNFFNYDDIDLSEMAAIQGKLEEASSDDNAPSKIDSVLNNLLDRLSEIDLSACLSDGSNPNRGASTSNEGASTSNEGASTSNEGASASNEGASTSAQNDDVMDD